MRHDDLLGQLSVLQNRVLGLLEDLDEQEIRAQYHPDLSPVGWHLGHCVYTESYWLHEVVLGNKQFSSPFEKLYTADATPKELRGKALPKKDDLLHWATDQQALDLHHLAQLDGNHHELLQDNYLLHFLIQHYSQHYENMVMVLQQKAQQYCDSDFSVSSPLVACAAKTDAEQLQGGRFRVGGEHPRSYDNELPAQHTELGSFQIQRSPVSNAEYAGFMQQDGYNNKFLWSKPGWSWKTATQAHHPGSWRQNNTGDWFGIGLRGAHELLAEQALCGINLFEAEAYAKWAGGQLPHEHQWEAACRLQLLEDTYQVWEWCSNTFHPYQGFSAFPYKEYSAPWFDENHYTLRGGSMHTQQALRRASFRNFYTPEKKHAFTGIRLVF